MESTIAIEKARIDQLNAICSLLQTGHLPTIDINPLLENFFVAVDGQQIAGVIGMDTYGEYGLLRSAIVDKAYRNKGVATLLVDRLLASAKQHGIATLYLITNSAEEYFKRKGFTTIARELVPGAVLQSKEFNGLCPASAVAMLRQL